MTILSTALSTTPTSAMDLQALEAASFCGTALPPDMAITGPNGPLDIILVALGAITVLLVCIYTVKYLLRPRENNPDHIKRQILRDDY